MHDTQRLTKSKKPRKTAEKRTDKRVKPRLVWDKPMIVRETGIDIRTLGKRMAAAGVETQEQFTTREMIRIVTGDLASERLRLTREQADRIALDNAERRRELAPVSLIADRVNRAIAAIKAAIMAAANLERNDKEKILALCGDLWTDAIARVSARDEAAMESSAAL